MPGLIAIVGRPNVGKSALFNRIAGRRIAIVHDQPGVTRDRVTAEVEWRGQAFTLVDTGGIGLAVGEQAADAIARAAMAQVELAIQAAHLILFVVNVREGVVPLDREVAERLHRSGKPVLVAVNKADTDCLDNGVAEFACLGFDALFPVSAVHGRGIERLMRVALERLRGSVPAAESHDDTVGQPPLKLAIVGRPNVGKSSLVNALTRSERVVVSPVPGTTRDAVDVPFEVEAEGRRERYVLIDTAGLRKPRRVGDSVEFFSIKRAEAAIGRCDIALLVLDAEAGIVEQDKKVADRIVEARKACVVIVNKWDLFEESVRSAREKLAGRAGGPGRGADQPPMTTLAEFGRWVQEKLFFLDYAPVIFTSAKSGFHLDRLLEAVRYVAAQLRQRVPTALLNRTLQDAVERRQPVSRQGQFLKFFYATQTGEAPPTFVLFVNRAELFSRSYEKYLAGELRRAFGYEGCPIVLIPKPRPRTVEPIRTRTPGKTREPRRSAQKTGLSSSASSKNRRQ